MTIGVTFGAKENPCGKEYSYRLAKEEPVPKIGSVIRMMDENYNFIHNGTRVRVISIHERTDMNTTCIRYMEGEEEF